MLLNDDDLNEFIAIYRDEFGEELSAVDAEGRARQLLTFYEIILQINRSHHQAQASVDECGSRPVDSEDRGGIVDDASLG